MALAQEIKKIQDKDLKKKLSQSKTLTPENALKDIKAWRNKRVAFRVFISIVSFGLFPLFFYLWAKKNKHASNWVTIPLQKTKEAVEGIQQLIDGSGDEAKSEASKDSEDVVSQPSEDSSKNSASRREGQEHDTSSSEVPERPAKPSVPGKSSSKVQKHSSSSSEEPESPAKPSLPVKSSSKVQEHSSSSSEEPKSPAKSSVPSKSSTTKSGDALMLKVTAAPYKPETVSLQFPVNKNRLAVAPQVLNNGVITFKCDSGKVVYFEACEILRGKLVSLSSQPLDHRNGLVSFCPTDKNRVILTLDDAGIKYLNTTWPTVRLSVIPKFFIPTVSVDAFGQIADAISVFHHKKNHIAIHTFHKGKSSCYEVKLSDNTDEDTIQCACVNGENIYIGHSDGTLTVLTPSSSGDAFRVDKHVKISKESILSIAFEKTNNIFVILLSNGTLYEIGNTSPSIIRRLDIRVENPAQSAIGLKNGDLLIVSPAEAIIAKDLFLDSENILDENPRSIVDLTNPCFKEAPVKQFEGEGSFIAVFRSPQLNDPKPNKFCIVNKKLQVLEFLFERGLDFDPTFLKKFLTASGKEVFYYLNYLTKELEFYNRVGTFLGSVKNFHVPINSEFVFESFEVKRGTGSKILLEGSFIVTAEKESTRYQFTESTCTTEKVADPAAAYSSIIAKRDHRLTWAASTLQDQILGCNCIKLGDRRFVYEIGYWPLRTNHDDMRPKHSLFITDKPDADEWIPVLTNQGTWNFVTYSEDGILIYDSAGKEKDKIMAINNNAQLIPVEISTNEVGSTALTVFKIFKSQVQLILYENRERKCLLDLKVENASTAYYDKAANVVYVATKDPMLHRVDLSTGEVQSLLLTDLPRHKDVSIIKMAFNAKRDLVCALNGYNTVSTYFLNFDTKEAVMVGGATVEQVNVFDLQFVENDNFVRLTTSIGSHEYLNNLVRYETTRKL